MSAIKFQIYTLRIWEYGDQFEELLLGFLNQLCFGVVKVFFRDMGIQEM